MGGSLIEMFHTVRRLVCGGWCMKKEMVFSAYCAECTTVKTHSTTKEVKPSHCRTIKKECAAWKR